MGFTKAVRQGPTFPFILACRKSYRKIIIPNIQKLALKVPYLEKILKNKILSICVFSVENFKLSVRITDTSTSELLSSSK